MKFGLFYITFYLQKKRFILVSEKADRETKFETGADWDTDIFWRHSPGSSASFQFSNLFTKTKEQLNLHKAWIQLLHNT